MAPSWAQIAASNLSAASKTGTESVSNSANQPPHRHPPADSMTSTPPAWDCTVCLETFHDFQTVNIAGDSACASCVGELFDNALKHEHNYPPRWGVLKLQPAWFSHVLRREFEVEYARKEREYRTPVDIRIYCAHLPFHGHPQSPGGWGGDRRAKSKIPCGTFVGREQAPTDTPGVKVLGKCQQCGEVTCMVCRAQVDEAVRSFLHSCEEVIKENKAFEGLEKGKDYQSCPSCRRRIELSDGCNHISCVCGTGFCFLCGERAQHYGQHWRRGGCPQFNHPEDENAIWDEGNLELLALDHALPAEPLDPGHDW